MPYEFKTDKRGNRRFARLATSRVVAVPKGTVTVEPAKPATVAKVDIDSGEVVAAVAEPVVVEKAAVSVPTTKAAKTKKAKKS